MTIIEAIAHESKLAEEDDGYHKQLADWLVQLLKVQTDNDRLRELVRHMYECMSNVDADGNYECDSCEYDNEDGGCDFERLLDELGVDA